MSPAEQRTQELVDRWVASLELHLRYADLTDEAYWQVQPWPRHQRPARWILELALQRTQELRRQLTARAAAGDAAFADALELMSFLANLVGAQHIERFVPLAERERENPEALDQTRSTFQPLTATATHAGLLVEPTRELPVSPPSEDGATSATQEAPGPLSAGSTATVEVLELPAAPAAPPSPTPPAAPATPVLEPEDASPTAEQPRFVLAATASGGGEPGGAVLSRAALEARMARPAATAPRVARSLAAAATRDAAEPPSRPRVPPSGTTRPAGPPAPRAHTRKDARAPGRAARAPVDAAEVLVVADAVRLLKWGRDWHELAEAIARMADRPSATEVRRVLRTHKATIEAQSRG